MLGARLEGHGTRPSDLRGVTFRQWIDSAEKSLDELRSRCGRVFIIGFSMGGTIALHIAGRHPVEGIIAICAPVRFDYKTYLGRTFKFILDFKSEIRRNIKDPSALKNHQSYSSVPPGTLLQFLALLRETRSHLEQVTAPVLLLQARDDMIISPQNAPYILEHLVNTKKKRLVWLDNSGHMATLDYDKDIVFKETYDFIKDCPV